MLGQAEFSLGLPTFPADTWGWRHVMTPVDNKSRPAAVLMVSRGSWTPLTQKLWSCAGLCWFCDPVQLLCGSGQLCYCTVTAHSPNNCNPTLRKIVSS